jgi:hypothetical protein
MMPAVQQVYMAVSDNTFGWSTLAEAIKNACYEKDTYRYEHPVFGYHHAPVILLEIAVHKRGQHFIKGRQDFIRLHGFKVHGAS